MVEHPCGKLLAQHELGKQYIELRLRCLRMTPSQTPPGEGSNEPRQVIHQGETLRGSQAAQGRKLGAERLTRGIPSRWGMVMEIGHTCRSGREAK